MSPTLLHNQYVVTSSLRFSWNELRRGDIVVFHSPASPEGIYIKRIIGLPDEYIELKDGRVYIDDKLLEERYISNCLATLQKTNFVSKWYTDTNEYFVLGDNRSNSGDSRTFGPIDRRLIVGRVWLRCWPLKDWKLLS